MGLTTDQVLEKEKLGQSNKTKNTVSKSAWAIFRDYVFTLFNLFNVAIGVLLIIAGAYSSILFLLVVLLNVLVGVVQEFRARALINKMSIVLAKATTVIRDGKEISIDSSRMVLGDSIKLQSGEQIVCDCVVLSGEVEVNESLLTGESDAIVKKVGDKLLSGSFVASGTCVAEATVVGDNAFSNKLAKDAKKSKRQDSVLVNSMRKITKITSILVIPIGLGLFLQFYFFHFNPDFATFGAAWQQAIPSMSAAILGMLPRGLMLLMSIALATGVIKLAKNKILVQDLYATETLARVNILCLDKTGTITEGKMKVKDFVLKDTSKKNLAALFMHFSSDNNATATALKDYFKSELGDFSSYTVSGSIPFSSERKFSAISITGVGTIVLGASEVLGERPQANGTDRELVFGFSKNSIVGFNLPKCEAFARVILDDPIRKNAKETLKYFRNQGVMVKIISGDNAKTVSTIALKAGLENGERFLDCSNLSDEEVLSKANDYTVFGRVTPKQKQLLVSAFKQVECVKPKNKFLEFFSFALPKKNTVAFVGDGVNDVLALREADCSIALASGATAARQVSSMVLMESDFTYLPKAVDEGRRVVHNITRAGGIFFIKTIYSVLLSLLLVTINMPFPFIPIQITFIDLIIEGFPSFIISFQKDTKPIKQGFLSTSFMKALPNAIMVVVVTAALFIIHWAVPSVGFNNIEGIAFIALGTISLAAAVRACWPIMREKGEGREGVGNFFFQKKVSKPSKKTGERLGVKRLDKVRLFTILITVIGFYLAIFLFSYGTYRFFDYNFLHLNLERGYIWLAAVMSIAVLPPLVLLSMFIRQKRKV